MSTLNKSTNPRAKAQEKFPLLWLCFFVYYRKIWNSFINKVIMGGSVGNTGIQANLFHKKGE